METSRGFITMAFGSDQFIRMSKGLARSMRLHSPGARLAVATDSTDPELKSLFDIIVPLERSFGDGVSQKFLIDKYSPFEKSFFIDADSLVFRSTDELWPMYESCGGFGAKGWDYLTAERPHHGVSDMPGYLAYFGVQRLPNFNAALFYFDRSVTATKVFETARKIYKDRTSIPGLRAFKNSAVSSESVFSMAMELNSVEMLPWENGKAMCPTFGEIKGLYGINVLRGRSRFMLYGREVEPVVIQFNMEAQTCYTYLRELRNLELMDRLGIDILHGSIVLPEYLNNQARYYVRRIRQRVRDLGILGILPERLLRR
jgi:hypothetical protein